jgi:hypothetical protein
MALGNIQYVGDDHTHCGGCGKHWSAITSREVAKIKYASLESGIVSAIRVYETCRRFGVTKCSLDFSYVKCDGEIKLGLLDLTDQAVAAVAREVYAQKVDSAHVEEYAAQYFAGSVPGEMIEGVSLGELFAVMLGMWNSERSDLKSEERYQWKLSSQSLRTLSQLLDGQVVSADSCIGLDLDRVYRRR